MSTSDKIFNIFTAILIFIDIVISAVYANIYAVGGWLVALIMFAETVVLESKLHDWKAKYSESMHERDKLKCEIAELRAQIGAHEPSHERED